jgi:hypothetical protein
MNTDIRVLVTLPTHPKTIKLMRKYGDRSFYCLIRLWSYVAQNKPSGVLGGWDDDDIEIAADWQGEQGLFIKALIDPSIRFMDDVDGVYHIHDWEEHNTYASKADERSGIASNAARARWGKRAKGAKKASGDADSKGEQIPIDASSNAPSMQEQCSEHKTAMLDQTNSNAPSPSPSPSPKEVLSKESPPRTGGKVRKLSNKKPKQNGSSKHYSNNVGNYIEMIRKNISKIGDLSDKYGWRFNVHAWIQQKADIRGHPKAINDSLLWLIDNAQDDIKDPWGFTDNSYKTLNPKYNEQDHIAEAEAFKTLWLEKFRPLVESIGSG